MTDEQRELSSKAEYLLDVVERLDRKEYERIVGPGIKQIPDKDFPYLKQLIDNEMKRRGI